MAGHPAGNAPDERAARCALKSKSASCQPRLSKLLRGRVSAGCADGGSAGGMGPCWWSWSASTERESQQRRGCCRFGFCAVAGAAAAELLRSAHRLYLERRPPSTTSPRACRPRRDSRSSRVPLVSRRRAHRFAGLVLMDRHVDCQLVLRAVAGLPAGWLLPWFLRYLPQPNLVVFFEFPSARPTSESSAAASTRSRCHS